MNLDERILRYLTQDRRGVGLTWLMAVTGEQVNAVAAAVVRLEDAGLISPGPGPWPLYRLAGCQETPKADAAEGQNVSFLGVFGQVGN